jgi:hypothetical protein
VQREPELPGEPRELAVVAAGDDDGRVGRGEDLVGDDVGMRVPHPPRHPAADQPVGRLVGEDGELAVEEPHVDPLAAPRPLAQGEGRLDRDGAVEAGEDVGIGDAGLLRRAAGLAGDVHDPAHRLDDEVVAGAGGVGTVLPEAGDRAVDDARVLRGDGGVVEAEPGEAADLEVLDHDIGRGGEAARGGEVLRVAEVEGDRALAAVGRVEVGGRAILGEGRAPAAGLVALGRLDLDDVGTEIGERLADPRAGEHAGELEHLQSGMGPSAIPVLRAWARA